MHLLFPTVYWYVLAVVLALIEIEIEGKYGWAEKLPTWCDNTSWAGRIYTRLLNGKPLTGYHLCIHAFCLLVMVQPYAYGTPITIENICKTVALFFTWAIVWDFHWFVLNPHYGLKRFKRTNIWWFADSYWPLGLFPSEYFKELAISYAAVGLAAYVGGTAQHLIDHSIMVGGLFVLTLIAIVLSPIYRAWRTEMDEKNDWDKVDTFHNA